MEQFLNNHNLQDHNYIVSTPIGEMQRNRDLMEILDSENSDQGQSKHHEKNNCSNRGY